MFSKIYLNQIFKKLCMQKIKDKRVLMNWFNQDDICIEEKEANRRFVFGQNFIKLYCGEFPTLS
jgi:hypothetical protein